VTEGAERIEAATSLAHVLDDLPLRAGGFIVTLYGDVVAPRGGEVWIGNIIDTCAAVGISETLVRTAVSRLVSAGRLEGRRDGRRSFYRLTDAARTEFDDAARAIYGPDRTPGWHFVYLPDALDDGAMAQLERAGFARLKPNLAVGPDRAPVPDGALVFAATPEGGSAALPQFAAGAWDLAQHARAYDDFVARFANLAAAEPPRGDTALTLRLLLVHCYRQTLLRDPRLPAAALPARWPGHAARRVFAEAYLRLSPGTDSHVGSAFENMAGALPATNATTDTRLALLGEILGQ